MHMYIYVRRHYPCLYTVEYNERRNVNEEECDGSGPIRSSIPAILEGLMKNKKFLGLDILCRDWVR
jgi:hypothetical protein